MTKFVHLHLHTEYSMLDGMTRINSLFQECKERGMPAVAITDHGNMYGAVAFNKAAVAATDKDADALKFVEQGREYGVKPIFGCEFYVDQDMHIKASENNRMPKFHHLVLLAKDLEGYRNLVKLSSAAFVEGFYYKPRIDYKLLQQHSKGLICLSACLAGGIPQALLRGDAAEAERLALFFKDLFGEDFYIEIQDHGIADQKYVLPQLIALARKLDIELVATNDVHYLKKSDAEAQRVLQCINFRTTIDDDLTEGGSGDYFPTQEFYLKTGDEMSALFGHIEGAIENTLKIAQKCNVSILKKEELFPKYATPDGSQPGQYLKKLTFEGLSKKYPIITEEIKERALNELTVIEEAGFSEYYLIVWDFIFYAESIGIPVGPGRGSGVGSLVAYAIGITKVDPIKYGLLFERFLNSERVSPPDFDIDFCVDRRDEVIQYVVDKYGADKVAQIITFGTLAPKNAIKDVGRVYNYPFSDVNKITKAMPGQIKDPLSQLVGLEKDKEGKDKTLLELKELYQSGGQITNIIDMAMRVEGLPRQSGMHAAGVVICRDTISDHIPLQRSGEDITTQFNKDECEQLGLLKMDFLGLRTLTDIKKALDYVEQNKGVEIDFYNMEYNDPEVFKMIGEGDTHAVFQLESAGMKRFMTNLKPESLEDIIAGISLYRPGPMDSIPEYVRNKKNPQNVHYAHPVLEQTLKVTYGIIVYQEQVMRVFRDLAGFTMGGADNVRKLMSKKKKDEMKAQKELFIKGCAESGVSKKTANEIFDKLEAFASYAFNKSHAAAYAYVAYQTAFLKRYYPLEFIAAVLNNRITNISELANYLLYLREKNIAILSPDINKSQAYYTVEGDSIRIGLGAIKNVGMAVIEDIIKERNQNGDYKSFSDFVSRLAKYGINKKLLESFILSGVFDSFNAYRSQLMAIYETVVERALKDNRAKQEGQFSMFEFISEPSQNVELPKIEEFHAKEKYLKEKEMLGIYVTGSPLDEHKARLCAYALNSSAFCEPKEDEDTEDDDKIVESVLSQDMKVVLGGMLIEPSKKQTKRGSIIGYAKLEDLNGTINIMAGERKLESFKDLWEEGKMVTINGKVSLREGEAPVVWIDDISEWDNTLKQTKQSQKMMCLYYSFSQEGEMFFQSLLKVLGAYQGNDTVFIKNTDDNRLNRVAFKVEICTALEAELQGFLHRDSIKIIDG